MAMRCNRTGTFPNYVDHYICSTEAELLVITAPMERTTGYSEDTQQNWTWTKTGWKQITLSTPAAL